MTVTGNEDHSITLAAASQMTKNYREANPTQPTAHMFGKSAISEILGQAGCVGIRIYYAITDTGQKQLVICGVNGSGNDLYTGQLADRSFVCPPDCSAANPLNTL